MTADTMTRATETDDLLRANPDITVSFSARYGSNIFHAFGYWPNDILRGKQCFGEGATIVDAVNVCMAEIHAAKTQAPKLRTAAECKDAVIALIREHEAAPASFRDAVDALPVADDRR